MKTYDVKVTFTHLEIYRVHADDEQEAQDNFAGGTCIYRDDEALCCNFLSVEEVNL